MQYNKNIFSYYNGNGNIEKIKALIMYPHKSGALTACCQVT